MLRLRSMDCDTPYVSVIAATDPDSLVSIQLPSSVLSSQMQCARQWSSVSCNPLKPVPLCNPCEWYPHAACNCLFPLRLPRWLPLPTQSRLAGKGTDTPAVPAQLSPCSHRYPTLFPLLPPPLSPSPPSFLPHLSPQLSCYLPTIAPSVTSNPK